MGKIEDRGVTSLFDCKENYSESIILLQVRGDISSLNLPFVQSRLFDVAMESESCFPLTSECQDLLGILSLDSKRSYTASVHQGSQRDCRQK